MPELISVSDFIAEAQEDYSSPTTSSFTTKMASCRNTANGIEEALDLDRVVLQKMKKAAKAQYASGQDHISHLENYIASMERLAQNFRNNGEYELATAFNKFAEFSKEPLTPMKNLLQSLFHNINFFLDSLVKGDLKDVKGDLKKPFDKAWKDYENKFTKIEKEKRELAKQYGMVRTEVSGGEIAEELEKERRMFQLQMCEYLIKVNEIKTKKGVDLLQNLIKHYHSQYNYFQECLTTTEKLKQYIEALTTELAGIKQRQDEEKKQLCLLRDLLKPTLQLEQKEDSLNRQTVYSMHQLQANKQYGTEKSGYLYKKSDGLRKVWQKRKCTIQNCYLTIAHGTPNRPPTKLNLLTCQVKPSLEDKKCFDLISHNRTYHFLADDELECTAWISVLTNSKQEALNVALDDKPPCGENSIGDLTKAIIDDIRRMPGNNMCCDCGAPDPTWLSTNLGILTCIECSGIHRKMGVHHSRIQSLALDKLGTSELLVAKNIGNTGFNEIMEASLKNPAAKPSADSDMNVRKDFIIAKYVEKKFARRTGISPMVLLRNLQDAVTSKDMFALLRVYAENLDLSDSMPLIIQEPGEAALHLAVLLSDRTSLHMVDFLVHNSNNLDKQTVRGNTALHYCCQHNNTECLKLLLRAKANTHIKNENGETALDVARRLRHTHCEELVSQAQCNQFNMHVNVEYEWRLRQEDVYESDDDLDEKDRSCRPISLYQAPCTMPQTCSTGQTTVGRRLAALHKDTLRDIYATPNKFSRSLDSPQTTSPPCFAPPLPPRVRAPNIPPPPPPSSSPQTPDYDSVTITKKNLPPPLVIRHKRTLSEPTPQVPHSPLSQRHVSVDHGLPVHSRGFGGPENLYQKPSLGSPKYTTTPLNSLPELPEKGFQNWTDAPSHNIYQTPVPSCKASLPNSPSSKSSMFDGVDLVEVTPGTAPYPLPRKNTGKPKLRRVKAIYDCIADHSDELTFKEGEVIVVTAEEDADWWMGYIEAEPYKRGLFPASFVHILSD
uniref:Arf-GAP with SH3 domain, ANK repeat and PH domain-containing protein 3 n=1 Tax=Erpetoichthys calabaricus TaxID=27687 RepID=A0A8C4SC15_ERPCA